MNSTGTSSGALAGFADKLTPLMRKEVNTMTKDALKKFYSRCSIILSVTDNTIQNIIEEIEDYLQDPCNYDYESAEEMSTIWHELLHVQSEIFKLSEDCENLAKQKEEA